MFESFAISDPGSVRTNNEDYYLVLPEKGLYVVADGMGGTLKRSHRGRGPHANQADAAAVGLRGIDWSAHLHRKRDRLRQQDRDEEERVLEPGDEFHRT